MTKAQRYSNLGAAVVPLLAVIAVAILSWNHILHWSDLAIFAVMYVIAGLGVTVGFHRLLTHRSFATYKPIGYALAVAGSLSVQGPVTGWVADHRKHHAHTDEEGDPHSPHVGHGEGVVGAIKGLWWAHLGWLLDRHGQADPRRYARDLVEDPGMKRITRAFVPIVIAGLLIPAGLGLAITGTLAGAATALLWGGLVRVFLLHHVTWSVNSVCHFFGRRRFETDDESTNVTWVALLSFGEGWHHNHHAFPRSAKHGLRWYEPDVTGLIIGALERLGLAWNVVRITPERQRARLATDAPG
ncbi:MAG TPA: fatty acid desaturase [Solirubrobacteraceae bacterium]|jgi:stearoyl-CoA desaturase (delta-9 desaturase)|nr:fatty acid desaturase [Solirubrobacteraceae bacterium]